MIIFSSAIGRVDKAASATLMFEEKACLTRNGHIYATTRISAAFDDMSAPAAQEVICRFAPRAMADDSLAMRPSA